MFFFLQSMVDQMLNSLYPLLSMGMEWSPSTVGVKITVKMFVFGVACSK